MLTHKTTKAHYNKYANMVKANGLAITNLRLFKVKDKGELLELYKQDPNLNNIPLHLFDSLTNSYNVYHRKKMSLADGTCCYKHLLIYNVLGATPEFE